MEIAMNERTTLRVSEAAELLGVSKRTVYAWAHRADFPAFRRGGLTLICREKLEEWARTQAEQSMSARRAGVPGCNGSR